MHTAAERSKLPEKLPEVPRSTLVEGAPRVIAMQIFIGNIGHSCTREEIRSFCEKVAPLYHLHIPAPKSEGANNPGYAFAMYHSRVAAAEAIETMAGSTMPSSPTRRLVRPSWLLHPELSLFCYTLLKACQSQATVPRRTRIRTFCMATALPAALVAHWPPSEL